MAKMKKRTLTREEKLLKGYQRKLTLEAIVKSLVLALIAGFMLFAIRSRKRLLDDQLRLPF